MGKKILIIVSTYEQYKEIQILINSLLIQTDPDWHIVVINDGEDEKKREIIWNLQKGYENKFEYYETAERENCFGHNTREEGLKHFTEYGDYVLITNGDNYYVPILIESLKHEISENTGMVYFDMVHSHDRPDSSSKSTYGFFETHLEACRIDVGAFIVRSDIAKLVGFKWRHSEGDANYMINCVKECVERNLKIKKINKVLFVHN